LAVASPDIFAEFGDRGGRRRWWGCLKGNCETECGGDICLGSGGQRGDSLFENVKVCGVWCVWCVDMICIFENIMYT